MSVWEIITKRTNTFASTSEAGAAWKILVAFQLQSTTFRTRELPYWLN